MVNKLYIHAGTEFENPVILNRNDADGQWGVWEQEEVYGTWRVHFEKGNYNFRFRFLKPVPVNGRMMIEAKSFIVQTRNTAGAVEIIEMKNVQVPDVKCDFTPFYLTGQKKIFPFWVEIEKR
jgi:arylsulfatase